MSTAKPLVAFYTNSTYVDFVFSYTLAMINVFLTFICLSTWYQHFRKRRDIFYRGILVVIITLLFCDFCRIGLTFAKGTKDPVNTTNLDLTRSWFQQLIQPAVVVLLAWRLQGIVNITAYFKAFQFACYGLFLAAIGITTYRQYLDANFDNADEVNGAIRNKLSSALIFICMVFEGICTGTYLYALNRLIGNNRAFNMRSIFFGVAVRSILAFSVGFLFAILDNVLSVSSTGPLLQLANNLTILFLMQLAKDLKGQHLAVFGNSSPKNTSQLDSSLGHSAEGLLQLLESKEFTEHFAAFLKTRFCEESLLYVIASVQYRKAYATLDAEGRKKEMGALVDTFIRDSGEYSINIKGTERNHIICTFEEDRHGADKDVLQMLVHGSYPLFLKTNDKFAHPVPDKTAKSAELISNAI